MSALAVCMSARAAVSCAGYVCDNPPGFQTIGLCEKIYHFHPLKKEEEEKKNPAPKCAV